MNYSKYQEWLQNPNINPLTGRKIKIHGPTYNKYKMVCENLSINPIIVEKTSPMFQTHDEYIKYIEANCYNMSDPISLEEFRDMTLDQLSTVIFIGDDAKKHAFLLEHIQGSIKAGNLRHPVTNTVLKKSEINTIMSKQTKKIVIKRKPYNLTFNYVGENIIVRFKHRLTATFPQDLGPEQTGSTDYSSAVLQVLLFELSLAGIYPKKYGYTTIESFKLYTDYIRNINI